jgi:hypothetical protein
MATEAKVPFYMYTSDRFLEEAGKFFKMKELPLSVQEAKALREEMSSAGSSASFLTGTAQRMASNTYSIVCRTNLEKIGAGFRAYIRANGSFPDRKTWQEQITTYMKEPLSQLGCPLGGARNNWGYAMNESLSDARLRACGQPTGRQHF